MISNEVVRFILYILIDRMSKEEVMKELEKLKDFKVYVFEWDVYVKAEDYREKAIENKNLKAKCDMIELRLSQFKRDNKDLEQENKNLKNELMEDMKTETKLNEEIKKLKSDLAYERTMLDNVKAEYDVLQEEVRKLKSDLWTVIEERDKAFKKIEKLKEELEWYKKQYEHSMWEDS